MEAKRTTVVLSYSLPHEVVFLEDGQFQVTIVGEHDWEHLDTLMED